MQALLPPLLAPGRNDNIGANQGRINVARKLISSGSSFEKAAGYSRAVVDGEWVFVSGTTGFDYAKMAISDDLAEQAELVGVRSRAVDGVRLVGVCGL